MAISGFTTPNTHMHGYNTIPLLLADTTVTTTNGYQYLVDLVSQTPYVPSSQAAYTINNNVYYQLNFSTDHPFVVGETIIDYRSGGTIPSEINTRFIVLAIPSSTSIVIDRIYAGSETFNLYKIYSPYKVLPDPNGYCKLDLGNSLKNYVTQNFEDSNDIFSGDDTRLKVRVLTGNQFTQDSIQFTDNYFSAGNVGFTTPLSPDLEVGDTIQVQQNPLELTYTDAFTYDISVVDPTLTGLYVAYILTDTVAQTLFDDGVNKYNINVLGQTTYPTWNGSTTIYQPFSSTIILTNKVSNEADGTYSGEGGTLYVTPVPEYNTTTTVRSIFYDGGSANWVIVTDIAWQKSTPAITGTIKLPTSNYFKRYDGPTYDIDVFNAYVSNKEWSLNAMSDYLIRNTSTGGPSTILSRTERNRIEQSTKSWLLFHNEVSGLGDGVKYQFYDKSNSLLSTVYLDNQSGNDDDFYAPVGIDQLISATNKTDTTPLSSVTSNIDYYTVRAIKNYGTTFDGIGEITTYELNDDCSRYDLLHLIWKDAKGSWLSYPFKYVHTDNTEVSRSEFYQQPFNWDTTDFNKKGNRSYFTRSRDKKILNSGWATEYENTLIRDLLVSADTHLQDSDGYIYGCQIVTNNLSFGSEQNEQIFQYTLEIKVSNDEIRL